MAPEGMVHALEQAHRVLRPGGMLADIRPDRLRGREGVGLPVIYGVTDREAVVIGRVGKTEARLRSYALADAAVDDVERRGLFIVESVDRFPFATFFRSPDVLDTYADAYWKSSVIDDATHIRVRAAVRDDPSREIVVVEPVRLNVMEKR